VLEPLDFMARLAALVPPPRMHLTRYHGVFAPHSSWRAAITPARRGKGRKQQVEDGADQPTPRHVAMGWAQRLKRVFRIEIEACVRCHGRVKVISSIEAPEVIAHILARLDRTSGMPELELRPLAARAPPLQSALLRCRRRRTCVAITAAGCGVSQRVVGSPVRRRIQGSPGAAQAGLTG
jgi:hypothetical protein